LRTRNWKNILWNTLLTLLGVICFPANPLVFAGLIEVDSHLALVILGAVVWMFGMVLVMAPIVLFPRRGGVPRGKSFVSTTRLVDSGIYAVVRHPQYTGGVLSIFFTTALWYPHWLFLLLGAMGTTVIYLSCREEDQRLIQQFGDDYKAYMKKVPRMNIILGIIRRLRQ
jgi:protein-S-isoprenylcysteine O-methyltransferase Ste14